MGESIWKVSQVSAKCSEHGERAGSGACFDSQDTFDLAATRRSRVATKE